MGDAQEQVFTCSLYIDSANTFDPASNEDCSCYTADECATPTVPAGFTNLDGADGAANIGGGEYVQATLSSGKRLLYASYAKKYYQEAVDLCASHGAEIVLPLNIQENNEVKAMLKTREQSTTLGAFSGVNVIGAFVRVRNTGYPTSAAAGNWVDARDDTVLAWDGDYSSQGGNRGIWDYSANNAEHGFIEPNHGTWKGLLPRELHDQRELEVICELPSL